MLYYALMFLVVGVIAGALNVAGVAAEAEGYQEKDALRSWNLEPCITNFSPAHIVFN
jgi:hypothetical protein